MDLPCSFKYIVGYIMHLSHFKPDVSLEVLRLPALLINIFKKMI